MTLRPGWLTGFSRRRLAVWAVGGLLLAGLGVGVAVFVVRPALDLSAAEKALQRHDPAEAHARATRCLARWPGHERALVLAASGIRSMQARYFFM